MLLNGNNSSLNVGSSRQLRGPVLESTLAASWFLNMYKVEVTGSSQQVSSELQSRDTSATAQLYLQELCCHCLAICAREQALVCKQLQVGNC